MTERDPNDLYHALRERLADYGQEPPAPLWANIRAQLPPPIAQHQLRKRRRKQLVLLLGLLLLTATAGWQYWHSARVGRGVAGSQPQLANARRQAEATNSGLATSESNRSSQATGLSADSATFPPQNSATDGALATNEASAPSRFSDGGSVTSTFQERGTTSRSSSIRPGRLVAMQAARGERGVAGRLAGRALREGAAAMAGTKATALEAGRRTPSSIAMAIDSETSASGASRAADQATTLAAAGSAAQPNLEQQTLDATSLAWRMAALHLPVSPLQQQLRADTLPRRPVAVVRRWAVQAVAGPALTYRALGSQDKSYGIAPSTASPNTFADANSLQDARESHGYGYGVQLRARRVLNGRWSLSAGLGYQEYAIERSYRVQTLLRAPVIVSAPNGVPNPTYSDFSHRDTYRFLTVPVQLSYALGQASHRLRYGLLGGAEAAFYLGGSSAGADGVTRTWSASTSSPYHSLSLAVSGGADFRYRVSSRLEAVAQPQATYFVNSFTRPASGLTPRHLVGTSIRLGMSYDLR